MQQQKIYRAFDLIALGLLPRGWSDEIKEIAGRFSEHTELKGGSSTSREPKGSKPVQVDVVTGEVIYDKLRWLYDLYTLPLAQFASEVAGQKVYPAEDRKAAVNINTLKGKGARYEWHVDSNPLTGLLFVTAHEAGDGGQLVFKINKEEVIVNPKAGIFIAFDARKIPHAVLPLKRESTRISIPMNYYLRAENQTRPSDLDSYLYRGER